ncbi:MAG TPA: tRNA (N(6)-L-threonylcarbamoyladenosine(37)-C(2))-methylthiotransferase MtaB [Cyclobacteriaceae bacterium]
MKKVAFYTLGCKLNYAETSTIARQFADEGYQKVDFTDTPDIYVINTCSVTENADKKCKKIVNDAKKISPGSFVIIIGCYAQLKPYEIINIPGVNAVFGAAEKFNLLAYLNKLDHLEPQVFVSDIQKASVFIPSYSYADRTRSFLKVQDGCNYGCAFCTIPLARGKSRSAPIADIIAKAEEIASTKVKEVVVSGINVGDFGIQNGKRKEHLIDLLKALDDVDSISRYRISSIEPNLLSNEIIEFIATSKRFVPHFHIPMQSGSNKILKLMNRRYRKELYRERVNKIKQLMPEACIGADVIVGFPGESEEDFIATHDFIRGLEIAYLHVFPYSERANTTSLELNGVVAQHIRKERSNILRSLSHKKRMAFYKSQLGKEATVLFEEGSGSKNMMCGFTENYVRVACDYDPLKINQLKKVILDNINQEGMVEFSEMERMIENPV